MEHHMLSTNTSHYIVTMLWLEVNMLLFSRDNHSLHKCCQQLRIVTVLQGSITWTRVDDINWLQHGSWWLVISTVNVIFVFSGMGASSSTCDGSQDSGIRQNDKQPIIEKDDIKRRGSSRKHSSGETVHCPTCQGTGRIPRGNAHTHTHTQTTTNTLKTSVSLALVPCIFPLIVS